MLSYFVPARGLQCVVGRVLVTIGLNVIRIRGSGYPLQPIFLRHWRILRAEVFIQNHNARYLCGWVGPSRRNNGRYVFANKNFSSNLEGFQDTQDIDARRVCAC